MMVLLHLTLTNTKNICQTRDMYLPYIKSKKMEFKRTFGNHIGNICHCINPENKYVDDTLFSSQTSEDEFIHYFKIVYVSMLM